FLIFSADAVLLNSITPSVIFAIPAQIPPVPAPVTVPNLPKSNTSTLPPHYPSSASQSSNTNIGTQNPNQFHVRTLSQNSLLDGRSYSPSQFQSPSALLCPPNAHPGILPVLIAHDHFKEACDYVLVAERLATQQSREHATELKTDDPKILAARQRRKGIAEVSIATIATILQNKPEIPEGLFQRMEKISGLFKGLTQVE
ncbi:MAG: hypothetical protein EZS28_050456, partial [Streblomastix strix]